MQTRPSTGAAEVVLGGPRAATCVRHVEHRAARAAVTLPLPPWLPRQLVDALRDEGVTGLWEHQATALEHVRAGRHVVVATGPASGKSLAYLLPAVADACAAAPDERPGGRRATSTTLYLSPTKALAADQLRRVERLGAPGLRAGTLDGDTPTDERSWVRDHAELVLTNPDMLSRSVLPQHERWTRLLRRLRYVVLDECHVYRGVFGAHVAAVVRRLRRVAALHGAAPTFVCCSATVAEPAAFAGRLTGLDVVAVTDDASPTAGSTTVLWDPAGAAAVAPGRDGASTESASTDAARVEAPGTGPTRAVADDGTGALARRGFLTECAQLVADLAGAGVRTLAFTGSRRAAESLARATRDALRRRGDPAAERVSAYRGGHLPEERRAVEQALRSGELLAVCATSALELGVDVAGLDAVVLAGWPGSVASLRQRAGRSGRREVAGLAVLVARDDPVDAYVLGHARQVLTAPVEAAVTDPDNPYVLAPHLACAAAEHPLGDSDLALFGPGARAVVAELTARGDLRRRPAGWHWARGRRPAVDLRGGGGSVQLVEEGTGRLLGTVDDDRAELVAHPGAVYQHLFDTYLVAELDLEAQVALLTPGDPGYVTVPRSSTDVRLLAPERERAVGRSLLGTGVVEVHRRTTGFVRRDPVSGTVLGEERLDLPERSFRTRGTWWSPEPEPAGTEQAAPAARARLAGALHAVEHAAVALLPLVALSDRHDVAGTSAVRHVDSPGPLVVVHDAMPGGSGFAERAFDAGEAWLGATRAAVASCPCRAGCPACVVQVGCGSGNQPLDKAGAVRLLRAAET